MPDTYQKQSNERHTCRPSGALSEGADEKVWCRDMNLDLLIAFAELATAKCQHALVLRGNLEGEMLNRGRHDK